MKIRKARKWDLREIGKVYADAYQESGYDWNDKYSIELMKRFYRIQNDMFFVAVEPGVGIVGAIWGEIMFVNDTNYLDDVDVFVDPDYSRKGVASELISHLMKSAVKKYQIEYVQGLVDSRKKFPLTFYRKIGLRDSEWINISGKPDEILEKLKR